MSAYRRAQVVFAYTPVRGEADVTPLVRRALARGKVVAFPRVAGHKLVFLRVNSLRELREGAFGIPEPASGGRQVPAAKADLVIVPGVAFSADGGRLGHGGGFYDRVLRGRRGVAVGAAFEFQVAESVPRGPRDASLDALVTEEKARIFGGSR